MTGLGFDRDALAYAARVAAGAALALIAGQALGLEHPQWAAMTVWAASQPMRGHAIEKAGYRMAGTLVGAAYGMALMAVSGGALPWLVVGISVWLGLAAAAGNLLRGFASYGAMLAGYTAAMVALLDAAHPDRIWALGADRVATVGLGVAVALAGGLVFARAGGIAPSVAAFRAVAQRVLAHVAASGAPRSAAARAADEAALVAELARVEAGLDLAAAGSMGARRGVRHVRAGLVAALDLMVWARGRAVAGPDLAGALAEAGTDPVALRRAGALAPPALADALGRLAAALAGEAPRGRDASGALPVTALHRDWAGARAALLRGAGTLLAVGAFWLVSGWPMGGYMMLGAAIMTSIFSTFENPLKVLPKVAMGQALGALGALACRWLVWPLAGGEWGQVLLILPFIALGALIASHRRSAVMGFDYNMVVLLLLQPVFPATMGGWTSLEAGGAVVAAPLIALVAFRLVFPRSAAVRVAELRRAALVELQAQAAGRARGTGRHGARRSRVAHRALVTMFWAERSARATAGAADEALGLVALGAAIAQLGEIARGPEPGPARRARVVLARLARLATEPGRARATLVRAARAGMPGIDRAVLDTAARGLGA
ncbi:FUSC family protein [Frigidibacter sp. MR17.24]|uniref:FUSC family protein n=1 Tax=Frigidibacter sp. MR17.24 TaxID=3127345 RepID=UPI003012C0AE